MFFNINRILEITKISGLVELIVMGSLGMIMLIVFIFVFVFMYQKRVNLHKLELTEKETFHQRELLHATIEVEEKERERIAKNMHDDIGTQLNVLKLHISKMARNPADKELVASILNESKSILETSIEQVRTISKDLMPPVLANLGFERAISELCRNINNSGSVNAVFVSDGLAPILSPEIQVQLYRITNEVITNVLKHAEATEIKIVAKSDKNYLISIQHNGKGIDDSDVERLSAAGKGVGMKSIYSRAQVINAKMNYKKIAINSAEININLPIVNNTSYEK